MRRTSLDVAGTETDSLYAPTLARRAASLHLSARILTESLRSGSFKSMYKGRGVEFSGVREYLPGDDVRSIDWNVTARMGRPFVKQFEEDRELVLFLVVDASGSMTTGGGRQGRTRLYTGCEVAALMSLAAALGGGSVGGVVFDGGILYSRRPKAGRNQALSFLNQLENVLASCGGDSRIAERERPPAVNQEDRLATATVGSSLDRALRGAAALLKKRALVLVISDFRTAGYERDLSILSARHDVVAVRIADPVDNQLEGLGSIPFADPESGHRLILPTSSASFRHAWQEANRNRMERWQGLCCRRGAWPLVVSTQDDVAVVLQRFFSVREA